MTFVVRSARNEAALAATIREVVARVAPRQPIYQVQTLTEHARWGMRESNLMANLLGPLGAMALLLATMGVYGVMSYLVAQRTRELGVRRALGAQSTQIILEVLRQGGRPVVVGTVIGLVLVTLGSRLLSGFLFGASAIDPGVFLVVAGLLLGAALAAMLVPARRASRVDPLVSLRSD
jgi:ABC-type antimicrobial peptide transport system permease subunit